MKCHFAALLIIVSASAIADERIFTIEDSLRLEKVVAGSMVDGSSTAEALPGFGATISTSPDGRFALYVTKRARVETNMSEYSLEMLNTEEVRAYVNAAGQAVLPKSEELLRFATRSSERAFSQVTWLPDGRRVAFIGTRSQDGETPQIYTLDVITRRVERITDVTTGVRSFTWNFNANVLVLSTNARLNSEERELKGYVFGPGDDIRDFSGVPKLALRYFALDTRTRELKALNALEDTSGFPSPVWISPNGRFAVSTAFPPHLPKAWSDFQVVRFYRGEWSPRGGPESSSGGVNQPVDLEQPLEELPEFGGGNRRVKQFVLFDLDSGAMRPLLDAPIPLSAPRVEWSQDSHRVVLTDVYIPLGQSTGKERERRLTEWRQVEVDVDTGRFHELQQERNSSKPAPAPKRRGLSFHLVESQTQFQGIEAVDDQSGKRRVVTDLNPWLAEKDLGVAREYQWTDTLGRKWLGMLVLPAFSQDNQPPPLVIQLNGYGGNNTSRLLQPFTSHLGTLYIAKGIAVLQVGCGGAQPAEIREKYELNPEFGPLRSSMICQEGAIDALSAAGLVDPRRVGIIGFSYAGNEVTYSVTFSKHRFAAAAVIDSVQSTLWSYLVSYGLNAPPGTLIWDGSDVFWNVVPPWIGAKFFGDGLRQWIDRSPTFHTDQIKTPILFENHGSGIVCACWETYVFLKQLRRPVELMNYPNGAHDLATPFEQLTSRHALLDWFSFWLSGQEDRNEEKHDQYERWRAMRAQQDKLNK